MALFVVNYMSWFFIHRHVGYWFELDYGLPHCCVPALNNVYSLFLLIDCCCFRVNILLLLFRRSELLLASPLMCDSARL